MTQLASDDFNRANNVSLGANWTVTTSETMPAVNSNACMNPGSNENSARWNGVTWPNDQYAQCTIVTPVRAVSDEGAGPSIRIASAAKTMYFAQANTVETRLYKCVTGTFTKLGTDGPACANGDILYLEASGTTITLKRNGSAICSTPLTDSSISTGSAGVWVVSTGGANDSALDDWSGGDLSAGSVLPLGQICL